MEKKTETQLQEELESLKEKIGVEIINKLSDLISKEHENTKTDFLHFELSVYKIALSTGRYLLEKSIPLVYGDGYKGSKVYGRIPGETYTCVLRKNKRLLKTTLGLINIHRAYYQDDQSGSSFGFLDKELGIHQTLISPGLTYYSTLLGTVTSYQEASDTLSRFGMHISDVEISNLTQNKAEEVKKHNLENIKEITLDSSGRMPMANINATSENPDKVIYFETDGCHVPVIDAEDESSNWTECKTMLLFEKKDDNVKNKEYFSTTQKISTFKKHVKEKIETYCGSSKVKVVVLGDGAKWIWKMAHELIPHSSARVEVLDWYHVNERIMILAGKLFPNSLQTTDKEIFVSELKWCFLEDKYDYAIVELNNRYEKTKDREIKEYIYGMINYFDRNRTRMKYKFYKKQGISIGSGAIESANKNVVQRRIKIPGARWLNVNADQMAQLRAEYINGNFDNLFDLNNPMLKAVT